MASAVLRPYLDHFHVATSVDLERHIVTQVQAFGSKVTMADLPIKLADAAARMQINPKPTFTDRISEGRLVFDQGARRFQILLNRHVDARRPRWYDQQLNPMAPDVKGRLRFTYAHELAHRCFYVECTDTWERLLDIVTRTDPTAYDALYAAEELLCDRIASRLLIPDDIVRHVGGHLAALIETHEIGLQVSRLAERCAVTRESFLVRLARAISLHELTTWPEDAICLLIGYSTRSGGRARAQRKLRVKMMLATHDRLGHFYPGMPVRNLSSTLAAYVTEALTDTLAITRIDGIPIPGPSAATLHGWSHRYTAPSGDQLLVWGRLHPDDTAETQDIKSPQLSLADDA